MLAENVETEIDKIDLDTEECSPEPSPERRLGQQASKEDRREDKKRRMQELFKERLDTPNIKRIVLRKCKETGYCYTFDDLYKFRGLIGHGAFGVVV
jgi:hypothetical protein